MGTAPYWWFLLLLSCVAVTALRYNYGNGSFYVGDVDEQGRPSGKGRFYNTSGTLEYEGDFFMGLPHGNGTWHGADGSRLSGEFREGQADGHGVLRLPGGNRVEGRLLGLRPEGSAVVQRANGERIAGQFRRGRPHGHVVWSGGRGGLSMDGAFRMGRPHGRAKVLNQRGELLYEGEFVGGRPVKPMPHNMNVDNFVFTDLTA